MGSTVAAGVIGVFVGGFIAAALTFLVFDFGEPASSLLVVPGMVIGGWLGYRIARASALRQPH